MFKWLFDLLEWCKRHQSPVVISGGCLWLLIKVLDWIGRGEGAVTLFGYLWNGFLALGSWVVVLVVAAILLYAHWPEISQRIKGPPFRIRPICGDTLGRGIAFLETAEVVGRIAVTNNSGQPLDNCTVRLIEAYRVHDGCILSGGCYYPSISSERGESFFLRWASTETITANRRFLDIPSDGLERMADVLVLDNDNSAGVANFAAANPQDIEGKLTGIGGGDSWWKLTVLISSENGKSSKCELVASVSSRDPGPIILDNWKPRGEQIVEHQRNEMERKKREKAEARQSSQPNPDTPDSHK